MRRLALIATLGLVACQPAPSLVIPAGALNQSDVLECQMAAQMAGAAASDRWALIDLGMFAAHGQMRDTCLRMKLARHAEQNYVPPTLQDAATARAQQAAYRARVDDWAKSTAPAATASAGR